MASPVTEQRPPPAPSPAPAGGWRRKVYRFARPLTPDEFMAVNPYALGMGEGRAELVGGDIVEMPPEFGDHTDATEDTADALKAYVAAHGGDAFGRVRQRACYPFVSRSGDTRVRCPDAALIDATGLARLGVGPGERLPRGFLDCVPLAVVEVLSEHDLTNPGDFQDKLWEYLNAGVALVWVLNPKDDRLSVYDQGGGLAAPTVLRPGDQLDGGAVLPGFRVPVATLFRPRPAPQTGTPAGRPGP